MSQDQRECRPDGPANAVIAFIGATPDYTDVIRGKPLTGPAGATFRDSYLGVLEMSRSDVLAMNIVPTLCLDMHGDLRDPTPDEVAEHMPDVLAKLRDVDPAFVVALGRVAKRALEDVADAWLPHPIATRYYGERDEIARKLQKIRNVMRRNPTVCDENRERRAKEIEKRLGVREMETVSTVFNLPLTADGTISGYARVEYVSPSETTWTTSDTYGNVTSDTQTTSEQVFVTSEIFKKEDEKRCVTGVVMEPGEFDAHGDVTSADEIENAAYVYMLNSQVVGQQHSEPAPAKIVESYIAPVDMEIGGGFVKQGSWVMTVKVDDDDLWDAVKAGDYTGFSIGGFAQKV
jgi:uracil-DNA glycosylase family 4